jgi:hypothetical protein
MLNARDTGSWLVAQAGRVVARWGLLPGR